jgi:large subunit ribosomal protein L14
MIQKRTKLQIIDNTAGKIGRCIQVYNKKKGIANIGDIVLVSVIEVDKDNNQKSPQSLLKIKKGDIHKGVVVRTKKEFTATKGFQKKASYRERYDDNSIILIQGDRKNIAPLGNRVTQPISRRLSEKSGLDKILAIAPNLIL